MSGRQGERGSALPKVIPERIKEAREGRGLTSETFGELLGVSRQAVARSRVGTNWTISRSFVSYYRDDEAAPNIFHGGPPPQVTIFIFAVLA